MTKKERFINFIFIQLGVKLINDKSNELNNNRNWLYTKIEEKDKIRLLNFLANNNIEYEQHLNNWYWIKV